MSLNIAEIPPYISPPNLCTPSRIVGERKMGNILRKLEDPNTIHNVLDLGCGGGEYRFFFPGCLYTGIDISDSNFSMKYHPGVYHFILGSAVHIPLGSASQDFVFCSYAFEYFPEQATVLREINRVLRPGGKALLCVPTNLVFIYDLLSDKIREMGFRIGQASAQPGIQYCCPDQLLKTAESVGLSICSISSIYGWPILLFKTIYSWWRVFFHVTALAIRRITCGSFNTIPPLYKDRIVPDAKSLSDWRNILADQFSNLSMWGRLYILSVSSAAWLDTITMYRPMVEYAIMLRKPDIL